MAVRERPIIFTPENAQKCFDGSKTQTRRIMKMQPDVSGLWPRGSAPGTRPNDCLYGHIGDRLWIREAWADLRGMGFGAPCAWRGIEEADSKRCREEFGVKWRPSIHMPRWACRTVVEITDVRIERLNQITEEDAMAEGVRKLDGRCAGIYICGSAMSGTTAVACFQRLWESIHGKGSWNLNPWVWVLSFRTVAESSNHDESAARHSRTSHC